MAKKKWTLVVGASLVALGLRQVFPHKKKQIDLHTNLQSLVAIYAKKWTFIHQNGQTISLEITSDLSLKINERPIPTTLLELTPSRLALVDEYGYHLVLSHERTQTDESLYQLYDEADDQTYDLSKL